MNDVLRNVLCLIHNNVGAEDAPWMNRIACKYTSVGGLVNKMEVDKKQNKRPTTVSRTFFSLWINMFWGYKSFIRII